MKRQLSEEVQGLKNEVWHASQRLKAAIKSEKVRRLQESVRVAERKIKRILFELEYNMSSDEYMSPLGIG